SQNPTLQMVISVLNSTKGTEISNILNLLSQDAQDMLMKYIYKGIPRWGDISGSVLLAWCEKVHVSFGFAC
ncbi:actin-related protein 2/3 complex subunit 5, partial [Pisolithus microcarpus]